MFNYKPIRSKMCKSIGGEERGIVQSGEKIAKIIAEGIDMYMGYEQEIYITCVFMIGRTEEELYM